MDFEHGVLRPGSLKELIPQILQYNIHVMVLQETTWQEEVVIDLRTHTLLQTRKNTGIKWFGVAFTLDSRCKENILGFQLISERVLKKKYGNITYNCICTHRG